MKLSPSYSQFYAKISDVIQSHRIFTDPLRTLAYGTDASFYRLVPKIVIWANNADEVALIIKQASELKLPMVFRAAGTSLSGQAITDSILVVTSRDWNSVEISSDNSLITLAPSVIGSVANDALCGCHKKIGPDPASINSAMIGGIVANNASGMCCGVSDNSYKTIKDIKLIFADGSRLDTSSAQSRENFAKSHSEFLQKLKTLANKVSNDERLSAFIAKKYAIKNTSGYGLNSLIDFKDEFEIIKHLIVGSEGTLGFIESVTMHTIEDYQDKASALLIFTS
ncbi:MAG: 4Fe-4S ferredoxin, partial [Deltaproteobacteria bacterium]